MRWVLLTSIALVACGGARETDLLGTPPNGVDASTLEDTGTPGDDATTEESLIVLTSDPVAASPGVPKRSLSTAPPQPAIATTHGRKIMLGFIDVLTGRRSIP